MFIYLINLIEFSIESVVIKNNRLTSRVISSLSEEASPWWLASWLSGEPFYVFHLSWRQKQTNESKPDETGGDLVGGGKKKNTIVWRK